jgi:hypothetical protein
MTPAPGSPFYHQQACYWPSGWNYGVALPFDSLFFTADSPENNATDLNASGIIVGNMANISGKQQAVFWEPDGNGDYDAMSSLGDLGGGSLKAYASAVNNEGVTVGRSETSSIAPGKFRAFRSTAENGLPQTLSLSDDMGTATMVEGHQSWANDINNLGELVGVSAAPGGFRAMYKAPRTGKDHGWYNLGVLGQGTADAGDWSEAFAINDKGLIVGRSRVKVSQQLVLRAFVVSNEGNAGSQPMINLNNRAYINGGFQSAASDGWLLTSADRINADNWIIANGSKNGNPRAILLRPILNDPYQ